MNPALFVPPEVALDSTDAPRPAPLLGVLLESSEPRPAKPCRESNGETPESCVGRRRWGLAVPGMMGGNVIPMLYNEFVQPWKEISRTSPHTWSLYWEFWDSDVWEWDDNHFFNNQIFHPIQGSFYYTGARSNGFGYYESLVAAMLGSYLWECCSERRPGAWNDWINTTLGGAALGEVMHRVTSLYIDNTRTGIDRIATELLLLPLNAERALARAVYGHWWDQVNPKGVIPDEWAVGLSTGLRFGEAYQHPFLDVQVRYGSPFEGGIKRPYDMFALDAQFNARGEPIGLVQVQAHLYSDTIPRSEPIRARSDTASVVRWFLGQNYDYLDSSADPAAPVDPDAVQGYRYGAQSLSLGVFGTGVMKTARLNVQIQGDVIPIGAVNSLHSRYQGRMPEREREYDFGIGVGGRLKLSGLKENKFMFSAGYQVSRLNTLNGSTACQPGDPIPCNRVSWHVVSLISASLRVKLERILNLGAKCPTCRWDDHLWLGVDSFGFYKRSLYKMNDVVLPNGRIEHRTWQFRVMLTWSLSRGGTDQMGRPPW